MNDVKGLQATNAKQILLVEDDAAIAEMLIALLEMEGYDLVVAYTGTEGLQLLTDVSSTSGSGGLTPDLILLDLNLPGMDGAEMIRRASQNGRSLPPLIILSAKPTNDISPVASSIHAADFINKPFRIETLLDCIQRVLLATP